MPNDVNKEKALLLEVNIAIEKYRNYRKKSHLLHWAVLFSVAIAGFLTTTTGASGPSSPTTPWFLSHSALTVWGLITVLGALIVQNANPAKMAEGFEKKKDAMRAIRTAVKYRSLDLNEAAEFMETARDDPERVLELLSKNE